MNYEKRNLFSPNLIEETVMITVNNIKFYEYNILGSIYLFDREDLRRLEVIKDIDNYKNYFDREVEISFFSEDKIKDIDDNIYVFVDTGIPKKIIFVIESELYKLKERS